MEFGPCFELSKEYPYSRSLQLVKTHEMTSQVYNLQIVITLINKTPKPYKWTLLQPINKQ
jgi:hypothetical protein